MTGLGPPQPLTASDHTLALFSLISSKASSFYFSLRLKMPYHTSKAS